MPAMVNRKKTKRHKMIYKMLHRKLQIDLRCFTSGTRRVTLVTNPVLSHEWSRVCNYDTENILVVVYNRDIQ